MKLIFMGTPEFSELCLKAMVEAGHDVVCVYSQPPRKSGRGHKVTPSPVQAYAQSQGIEVRTPINFKDPDDMAAFAALEADAAVVVAYGLILPQAILDAPKRGCINVHASLLPRWRGAAPIQRCIEAGDSLSGVGIMQMEAGLDTGPVIREARMTLDADETGGSLHDKLAALGAQTLLEVLKLDEWPAQLQAEQGMTYANKLTKAEAELDWQQSATQLEQRIRAFNPFPGAFFHFGKDRIVVLKASVVDGSGDPGTALDDELSIACGSGALKLELLKPAGKSVMDARAFLNGRAIPKGSQL